ncbi:MAG: HNH endonuclease [Limisphaerales bacterium]
MKDRIEWVKQKYQRDLKIYEEKNLTFQRQFQNWLDRKERAFSSKMPNLNALGYGVVFGFIGNAMLPVVGAFFGFFVGFFIYQFFWDRKQAKLDAAFRLKNPPPINPNLKPPSNPEPIQIDFELDDTRFSESFVAKNYRRQILVRDKYVCQNCGEQKTDSNLEVHHIQTQANDGPDHPTNLVTLCLYCHDRETWFDHKRMFPTTIRQRSRHWR